MPRSAGRVPARWAKFVLCCFLCVSLYTLVVNAPAARAQEPGDGEAKAAEAAPQPAARPDNLLMHVIKSLGWFFIFLFGFISVALVAMIILLVMDLRMGMAIPPGFVEDFTDTVNKRRFKEAYEMARTDTSYLGRVLTTGMSRLQYGIDDAREAAFNMVDSIRASKEQLIAYLATIGTLGPMFGLVGTVYGMIKSFKVLGEGGAPSPAKLADGISHALVVTLVGIALSVPAIFCHAFFKNRLTRIEKETGNMADDLLTQMYHNSKKPAAMPASAPAAAVVPTAAAIRPAE
ncbi:MAG TPA: MotA/TolQ/ExbB proton channel family protein [Gemmataceae bacterium]|nr:MotA/TolQ/ExbB proton channel family protein [Gemmataceae bacterium]